MNKFVDSALDWMFLIVMTCVFCGLGAALLYGDLFQEREETPKLGKDLDTIVITFDNDWQGSEHHALADARWNKLAFEYLQTYLK